MRLNIAILIAFVLATTTAYSQNEEALLSNGLFAFNNDNYMQTINDLSKYVEINKENALAYNTLGKAYAAFGNLDKAMINFQMAIKLDPKYYEAVKNLGYVYYDEGDFNKAISLFENAIKINPKYDTAYNALGNAYDELKNYKKAISYYTKAVSIS